MSRERAGAIAGFDHVSLPMERTEASSVSVRDPDGNLLDFMIYGREES